MSVLTHQLDKEEQTKYLGMIIALGSWTMLFVSMLFGYTVLRLQSSYWYIFELSGWPFIQGVLNTFVILMSSFFYRKAAKHSKSANEDAFIKNLRVSFFAGICFLLMQFNLWRLLFQEGLTIQSEIAGSMIYVLTGLHALHLVGGLMAIGWLMIQFYRHKQTVMNATRVILVGWFWHFLTIMWIIFFITIFVIH